MLFSPTTMQAMQAIQDGYERVTLEDAEERAKELQKAYAVRAHLARRVNAVLDGKFKPLILEHLESRFAAESFQAMALQTRVSIYNNVMVDCVNKYATTWAAGAEYTLGKAGVTVDNDAFTNMMERLEYTRHMHTIDRLTAVHPGVCVMPEVTWNPRLGKRQFGNTILTPESFDLIPCEENSAEWCGLIVFYEDCGKRFRTIYTVDEIATYEAKGKVNDSNPEWVMCGAPYPNPDGIIPAVIFKRPSEKLWANHFGEELLDGTILACAAETLLQHNMPRQIKVLVGVGKDTPAAQRVEHMAMLNTGAGQVPTLMDFQTDVQGFRQTFVADVRRQCLMLMGLKGDEFETTSQPASGEALKLMFNARDEQARARRVWQVPGLTELYWLDMHKLWNAIPAADMVEPEPVDGKEMAAVPMVLPIDGFDGGWVYGLDPATGMPRPFTPPSPESVLPPSQKDVPPDRQEVQFRVQVKDAVYPELATEVQAREQYDLDHHFTNPAKLLMARDESIASEDDAIEALLHNAEVTARVKAASAPPAPPPPLPPPPVTHVYNNTGTPPPSDNGAQS